jgi:L-seryl-tRNA(Ser) seleniumtransferase
MSRARLIPSLDAVLSQPASEALRRTHGERAAREALRTAARSLRDQLLNDPSLAITSPDEAGAAIVARAATALGAWARSLLQPVVNATGVVIHTNLGRAPLSAAARAAMDAIARGYVSLEFDLDSGGRGSRHVHAERWLRETTGAGAALVSNNTAAAMTLALSALAAGREVIISRGELVEIGGGFRVPDVLRASGAILREVGTTNRTRIADYAAAISERTAAVLRVHPSNFRMEGFTERPALADLADLGRRFDVPVLDDQGSGWLGLDLLQAEELPTGSRRVLEREPSVRESVRDGADLVGFSGDKLLGGPQAGIVVGRASLVERLRQHPLMRAVRADKLTYAALEATLDAWRRGTALEDLPVLAMIGMPEARIEARARTLRDRLAGAGVPATVTLRPGESTIGGGSLPGEMLPTTLVAVSADVGADALLGRLRRGDPIVVARIDMDAVCLDVRTVLPDQDAALADAVVRAARV